MTRVGFGYDVHAFSSDPRRALMLGGVQITECRGLDGHSDADVVLHAIADALLGACALGDIGDHFPPDDIQWRGVDSGLILSTVMTMLPAGVEILNVDCTVVAERPKIAPYRQDMRRAIADVLDLGVAKVSVKATTNEGLGSLGRGEGIAAFAVVVLRDVS